MDKSCDVLILSAGFGSGHHSAAQAIQEHLWLERPDLSIAIEDLFELIFPAWRGGIYASYDLMVRKAIRFYNYFYRRKQAGKDFMTTGPVRSLAIPRLRARVRACNPALIISTFPLSSCYMARLDGFLDRHVKLVTCITDVVASPEWVYPPVDLYLAPTPGVKAELQKMGLQEEQVQVTGIPVRPRFFQENGDREKINQKYGLGEDDFLLLLMGGGLGNLPEEESFYRWREGIPGLKTLVLTGHNQELRARLQEYGCNNISFLEFTDQVPELMKRADLLVSKAGGSTLFEAIVSGVPLLLYKPELGQELENCAFVLENDLGGVAFGLYSLQSEIRRRLRDQRQLQINRANLDRVRQHISMDNMVQSLLLLLPHDQAIPAAN